MKTPDQYSLTENAKEAARYLVKCWDDGIVGQRIECVETIDKEYLIVFGADEQKFEVPGIGALDDLARHDLIGKKETSDRLTISLRQELRNAVENNFLRPHRNIQQVVYKNIFQDKVTVQGSFQSIISDSGNIHQHTTQLTYLANELEKEFSDDFLQKYRELAEAIQDLKSTTESDAQSKLGRVISELGRCLAHGANTVAVTQGLMSISQFLSQIIG
jgi:hypothetical protein